MDDVARQDLGEDGQRQRREQVAPGVDRVVHRLLGDVHAVAPETGNLAMERQRVEELLGDEAVDGLIGEVAAGDDAVRRRLHDHLAGSGPHQLQLVDS